MKAAIISFTEKGNSIRKKIEDHLIVNEYEIMSSADGRAKEISLNEWTNDYFTDSDFLVFIGACAIAVRSIAPFLKSKKEDPGVIVIDEMGQYVIPILSGHIGGANEFAIMLAEFLGAYSVITTATDINNKFAVDVFAKKNSLEIEDMLKAKMISAKILDNMSIGLVSELTIEGKLPEEIVRNGNEEYGIYIGIRSRKPFKETLNLIPKSVTIGIGCRKDTPKEKIQYAVLEILKENNIELKSVNKLASIDLKKDEKGIFEFSSEYQLDFVTYSSDELNSINGDFSESEFVDKITGVSCVCERAAVMGSNQGEILIRKTIKDGVTVAVAQENRSVKFE